MAIAKKVGDFIADSGVEYHVINHEHSESASRSAWAAHIKGGHVAKTVVLHDGERYLLGVVPATHRVELDTLGDILHCRLTLATESEVARLFDDCSVGADPPLGMAYGLPVVVDESLLEEDDIFFEGGDHESLVHVTHDGFEKLMKEAQHARFSHHT
ncbi:MAG: YbaK/EbsC family protein [Rhodospirillales bacterium]|jgi:Ala-tRNA(Pro) deacylase|nr:YbaK/EbsC family protein [Rhodospirillales bacterium]